MIFKLNHVFFAWLKIRSPSRFSVSSPSVVVSSDSGKRGGGGKTGESEQLVRWFSSMKQETLWFLARGQLLSIVWPGCLLFRCKCKKRIDALSVSCAKQVKVFELFCLKFVRSSSIQSMVSLGSLIVKFLIISWILISSSVGYSFYKYE